MPCRPCLQLQDWSHANVHLYNRVSVHQGICQHRWTRLPLPSSPAEGSEQPSVESVCSVPDTSPFLCQWLSRDELPGTICSESGVQKVPRPGIVRMKSVAQGYVWWPGLYEDLSTVLSKSAWCQLWLHFIPDRPWDRVLVT